jgi:GNAT superfamily N-acetyltransferase
MDDSRYALRDFRESDLEPYAALYKAIVRDQPISAATFRAEWELQRGVPNPWPWFSVDERSSHRLVAVAGLVRNLFQADPLRPWIFGDVDPDHVHQGIGTHLYERVLSVAGEGGATGLRCTVRGDHSAALAFLAHRGFVERRRSWVSALDLASADTSALPMLTAKLSHEGIELTTLEREGPERDDVFRGLYDLALVTGGDVPRVGAFTPPTYEEYRRLQLGGPSFHPDSWMLAKEGDRYVGVSSAGTDAADPGVLHQWYTATRSEFRGRKVAETLKLRLIDFARKRGYVRITTANDSLNQPMWSLNQRLGFHKISERIHTEKVFDPVG